MAKARNLKSLRIHCSTNFSRSPRRVEMRRFVKYDGASAYPQASWKKMFLTTPQIPDVKFKASYVTADGAVKDVQGHFENYVTGIKLGDFIDHVHSATDGAKEFKLEIIGKGGWDAKGGPNKLREALSGPNGRRFRVIGVKGQGSDRKIRDEGFL